MNKMGHLADTFIQDESLIKYLNGEGREALFREVLKRYPVVNVHKKHQKVAHIYNLAKILKVSKPRLLIADVLEMKTENVSGLIELAKSKGLIITSQSEKQDYYAELRSKYIPRVTSFKFSEKSSA